MKSKFETPVLFINEFLSENIILVSGTNVAILEKEMKSTNPSITLEKADLTDFFWE